MLFGACLGFGISLGMYVRYLVEPFRPEERSRAVGFLSLALGLSHGSFLLLSLYHFTK